MSSSATKISWGLILTVLSGIAILSGLMLVFFYASEAVNLFTPAERYAQRIMYFHVGSAWIGFFAFFVTFIAGIMFLIKRSFFWDNIGHASVEIGLTFLTAVLISGTLWAKPTWNTWWTWSPRLTLSAIGWLMYVGYLMLRGAVESPEKKARLAAVYGIIAFLSVPLNIITIRLWRDIHPSVVGSAAAEGQGGFSMSGDMRTTLIYCVVAFSILYITLMYHRVQLGQAEHEMAILKQKIIGQIDAR
ncbi:MAG: hypothetical protein B6242_00280 [Anaerolineaceae bacterium 4572_78]|nr:MAG: hypothetical protein B6242_00280 [Anaerolineaceae bacterium 4572_78]